MAEEVLGVCGWSAVRRIDLDGDSNPGFEVLRIEGALCGHREHKRNTSSRELILEDKLENTSGSSTAYILVYLCRPCCQRIR